MSMDTKTDDIVQLSVKLRCASMYMEMLLIIITIFTCIVNHSKIISFYIHEFLITFLKYKPLLSVVHYRTKFFKQLYLKSNLRYF